MDLSPTIEPDSTQINSDDLVAGPVTVTIQEVRKGSVEQPVDVILAEYPDRAYRPSKSMRRVLVTAWGKQASQYAGRRITLFRNPDITFGREKVGGIEISHMSDLDKTLTVPLTVSRGKRRKFIVEPLIEQPQVETISEPQWSWLVNAGQQVGLDPAGVGSLAGDLLGAQLGSWQEIPAARLEDIANAVTEYGQAQPVTEDQ